MWKIKLDDEGKPVYQDGKVVYVKDDGSEIAVDVGATYGSVASLREEAKSNRIRAEKAESNLEKYAGIEDVEGAIKALRTVANLKDKQLIDAGEVERLKAEITKGWETKVAEEKKRGDTLESQLIEEKIGGAFARSKFVTEKVAVPPDMLRASFGNRFKVVDGKIVASDERGNTIHSRANPGEVADFEEALATIVESYPHKDSILKADQKPGTGTQPGTGSRPGSNGSDVKSLTRAAWSALPAHQQAAHIRSGGAVTD